MDNIHIVLSGDNVDAMVSVGHRERHELSVVRIMRFKYGNVVMFLALLRSCDPRSVLAAACAWPVGQLASSSSSSSSSKQEGWYSSVPNRFTPQYQIMLPSTKCHSPVPNATLQYQISLPSTKRVLPAYMSMASRISNFLKLITHK